MKIFFILYLFFTAIEIEAQTAVMDTVVSGKIIVIKDSRLEELAKKEAAFNEALASAPKTSKGYRLMVLSTNDRELAMKVRSQLLQRYPDQKAYTIFQAPYIKLKFGNYVERSDAENMRKEILNNNIVTGNIYIMSETVEVKPEKNKENLEN
jgi:hypothetical protein